MGYTKATGKYVKIKSGLFSTTTIAYHGDGDPPPEFFELEVRLRWFQKPLGLIVIAAVSGALGAGIAKVAGWT